VMEDSLDEEEAPKEKVKPNPGGTRMTGLVDEDKDDEPNEKLQKKLDKDNAAKEKEPEPKTLKLLVQREKSPASKTKFSSFIDDEIPSRSSKPSSSSSKSSSYDKKSSSSSSKHSSSSHHKHSSSSPSKRPSTSSSHKRSFIQ
jgi:hypothetical protein